MFYYIFEYSIEKLLYLYFYMVSVLSNTLPISFGTNIDEESFTRAQLISFWVEVELIEELENSVYNILNLASYKWIDLTKITYEWFLLALRWNINLDNGPFDLSIYNEMKVLRDIVTSLRNFHLSYLEQLHTSNPNIAIEKDHNSCDFAHYLKWKEWLIKNSFLLSILNLIKWLHEKFHQEVKNYNDFNSVLYLNDLLNILDILLKHEESIYFDEKTGLPNLERLKKDIDENWVDTIHLVKLNWISNVNLLYSYEIWDQILLKVIDLLKDYFAKHWFVLYRIGWLEFWILWWDENFFRDFYDKNNILNIELSKLWLTVPIKLSIWWAKGEIDIYNKALQALHESKWNWGYVSYSKNLELSIRNRVNNNLMWIMELNNAIKSWNLVTYFQWIVDNNTWEKIKEEALVRIEKDWKLFTPNLFLEQAKEWWLLSKITEKVLDDTIVRIKKYWKACSINISDQDVADEKMIKYIIDQVIQNGISPKLLTIEVLESITNDDLFLENIKKLKNIWIKIAIDDFWTWYSNFARIIELKPDYVKVDWSLIKWLSKSKEKQSVVRSIVNLAHLSQAEVIAEFVDNEEDQSTIEVLWIEYSQGYLFSMPVKWD